MTQNRHDTSLFYLGQDHVDIEKLLILETGLWTRITAGDKVMHVNQEH
jgi:hypothetical protein